MRTTTRNWNLDFNRRSKKHKMRVSVKDNSEVANTTSQGNGRVG